MHHPCKIHEGGVRAVEYEKLPIEYALDSDAAIEKARITVETREPCPNHGCEHYKLCFPICLKPSSQYEVKAVKRTLNCLDGRKLKEVLLRDIL